VLSAAVGLGAGQTATEHGSSTTYRTIVVGAVAEHIRGRARGASTRAPMKRRIHVDAMATGLRAEGIELGRRLTIRCAGRLFDGEESE
jgi:hypothetical protein